MQANGSRAGIWDALAAPAEAVITTTCCVVGGGPAGAMLALLLARAGIPVTLLESQKDFDRDYRGDTIHPSTLEILDQLGLASRLHQLPHSKIPEWRFAYPTGTYTVSVLRHLPTSFPYVMMMPQASFLEFLVAEATKYPHFRLVMGANAQQLLEQQGTIQGVRYRTSNGTGKVHAVLTVGADGRSSRIRKLAAFEPIPQAPRLEGLWFRLPRKEDDPDVGGTLHFGCGSFIGLLPRMREWQVGCVVAVGSYQKLKALGIEALQQSILAVVPWLADRVASLTDWRQVSVLSVEASRLRRWHRDGLLLIGDAAHTMGPVAGVGINYAIADAVETANVVIEPLRANSLTEAHLAEVQRRRAWPTKVIQFLQTDMQKRMINRALAATRPFGPPLTLRLMARIGWLRDLSTHVISFGVRRPRLKHSEESLSS